MKCRAKVVYYKKLNKSNKKKIAFTMNPDITEPQIEHMLKATSEKLLKNVDLYAENGEFYECQGTVEIEVRAVDEPYFGGSSAELDVITKCDTCGHRYYSNLPNQYNLNEWLNHILSEMD